LNDSDKWWFINRNYDGAGLGLYISKSYILLGVKYGQKTM
jgi:hypothetical protein